MKKTVLTTFVVLVGIIVIIGIFIVQPLKKYHDENTFADIEVVTKGRSLDPYEEKYDVKTFKDTCVKGSVIVLEPEDYTVNVMRVEHDGQVKLKVNSRGGLWADGAEYTSKDVITLQKGEKIRLSEEVTDMEFIIEIEVTNAYYR